MNPKHDPDEMIPIARAARRDGLGLGLNYPDAVYRRAKRDPNFPAIVFHRGKNYVRRADLESYQKLCAAREAAKGGRR